MPRKYAHHIYLKTLHDGKVVYDMYGGEPGVLPFVTTEKAAKKHFPGGYRRVEIVQLDVEGPSN